MERPSRIAFLLFAANLLVGAAHPRRPLAAETAEMSSTPGSQSVDTNSIQPSANGQAAPYQLEQNTAEPESQELKEYLDVNEQISVFGIDMRVETRTAEKEIQGLLVIDVAPGSLGAAAGLHAYRQPARSRKRYSVRA
jgi:hypothetical protein